MSNRPYEHLNLFANADYSSAGVHGLFESLHWADNWTNLLKPAAVGYFAFAFLRTLGENLDYSDTVKLDFILFAAILIIAFVFINLIFENDQRNRPIASTTIKYAILAFALYILCLYKSGIQQLYLMHCCALISSFILANKLTSHSIARLKEAVPICEEQLEAAHQVWRRRWSNPHYFIRNTLVLSTYVGCYSIYYGFILPHTQLHPLTAALASIVILLVLMVLAVALARFTMKGSNARQTIEYAIVAYRTALSLAINYRPSMQVGIAKARSLSGFVGNLPIYSVLFIICGVHMAAAYYYPLALFVKDHPSDLAALFEPLEVEAKHDFDTKLMLELGSDYFHLTPADREQAYQIAKLQKSQSTITERFNQSPEAWLLIFWQAWDSNIIFTLAIYILSFICCVAFSTLFALTLCFALAGPDIADLQMQVDLILHYATHSGAGP